MIEEIRRNSAVSYRARIVWVDGKRISQCFRRKTDAEKWERTQLDLRDKVRAGFELPKPDQSFQEFVNRWIKERVLPRLSPSTQASYQADLKNHILPVLGQVNLRKIQMSHGNQVVIQLKEKGRAPKSINGVIGLLHCILNDAVRWEQLERNPLSQLKAMKDQSRSIAFWTPTEIDQFLRANMRCSLYPLWIVALNTGMRKGEIAGLKWERVNFQRRQLEITRTLSRFGLQERTKSWRPRIIKVNQVVMDTLRPLWGEQRSEFVFSREDGRPLDPNHVYRDFHEAQRKAGFTKLIRFHDLRHTFASNFMMAGGNLYDLQKILGHATLDMVQRYAHLSPDHMEKAVEIVSFKASEDSEKEENPQDAHRMGSSSKQGA